MFNYSLRYTLIGILFLLLYIVLGRYIPSGGLSLCDLEKSIKSESFKGILSLKYIDQEDHSHKKIEISGFDGQKIDLTITLEKTRFYDSIQIGDTLIKDTNTLNVFIKNETRGINKIHTLSYNCNEDSK
jgi:hypothetical protein